jgi:protein required for attachment to host cells
MIDCAIRGTPGDAFTGRVADRLDKAAVACLYEHLVLVGPEPVLGALRGRLSADTAARVVSEVARDLGHATPRELACHLGPVLPH